MVILTIKPWAQWATTGSCRLAMKKEGILWLVVWLRKTFLQTFYVL